MNEPATSARVVQQWYATPVLFESSAAASLGVYVERLGWVAKWQSPEETVCQVDRGGCEIDDRERQP